MNPSEFSDLQYALYWFFGPVMPVFLVLIVAGSILSAIGVVILEVANRLTR